jgi:hypothetical protein
MIWVPTGRLSYATPVESKVFYRKVKGRGYATSAVFNSRRYQIFWEVVDLERGPLSLVSTIEELLEKKSSNSGLENREHGRTESLCWPRNTVYVQKLALTSPTSGCRSVGIVRLRTKATREFVCLFCCWFRPNRLCCIIYQKTIFLKFTVARNWNFAIRIYNFHTLCRRNVDFGTNGSTVLKS